MHERIEAFLERMLLDGFNMTLAQINEATSLLSALREGRIIWSEDKCYQNIEDIVMNGDSAA